MVPRNQATLPAMCRSNSLRRPADGSRYWQDFREERPLKNSPVKRILTCFVVMTKVSKIVFKSDEEYAQTIKRIARQSDQTY